MLRRITFLALFLALLLVVPKNSESQIIRSIGNSAEQASQLVFYYDDTNGDDTVLQLTNTNDTEGVWVHVQIFMSFDPSNGIPGTEPDDGIANPVFCVERNFVDFFTPNDTHIYDLDVAMFPKNEGETAAAAGTATTIDADDTVGFVVVTPVVSEVDFTAIAFKHLIGQSLDDDEDIAQNAMGRDALDFATGELVADGTPLDGVNNGFLVIQPEEVFFLYAGNVPMAMDMTQFDTIGIVFVDNYGPPGLLGYTVTPGEVTWTAFVFDFRENPTSCGSVTVSCFLNRGLNDTLPQDEIELNSDNIDGGPDGDQLLCAGTTSPQYDPMDTLTPLIEFDAFGIGRIFVSGFDDFENHLAVAKNDDVDSADWMFTKP